jgi:DnaJ-class molecular chaperone
MAKDEEEPPKCRTCNGQGGWWEHGNGQPGVAKPKHWIKCEICQGTGNA